MSRTLALSPVLSFALVLGAQAAPVTYEVDPTHTFPSFEADHMGGLSTWRGKFDHSKGTITMDREAGTGTVEITVDMNSGDFGLPALDKMARGKMLFDSAR
jgi:polyisoprenoid-binding protein YceI